MYYARYCRSVLFTSATHRQRFARARASGADVCIVDCEDSVSPRDKAQARLDAAGFFPDLRDSASRLGVRINGLCEDDGLADLLAIREWPRWPDIILVPKVESPRDIEIVLGVIENVDLIVLVETACGVQNVAAIARAAPQLKALIFGSADYSVSINSTMDWEALYAARAQVVLAAFEPRAQADEFLVDVAQLDAQRFERVHVGVEQAFGFGDAGAKFLAARVGAADVVLAADDSLGEL